MSDRVKRVLVDAEVVADMNVDLYRWRDETAPQAQARYAAALERACEEFHNHCRDHRSLDHIRLSVVRRYSYVCTACGDDYETEAGATNCECEVPIVPTPTMGGKEEE